MRTSNWLRLSPLLLAAGCASGPRGEPVTIYRDDFGIPNIFATTEAGACFGAGYAQAEDRLEELLKQYRRATGTMAEVFGPEHIEEDCRQRLWRHAAISREKYGEVTPGTRRLIEAYIAGVELYMERHPERVPTWAPRLEPWMVVALGRYIIWDWPAGDAAGDLRRGGIEIAPVAPRASNEWVVSGKRTASGAPIALIDPHLSWYGEFRFYEARLYGGALEVAGVGILGAPIPSLGHNRYLSVAMTTGGPDTADVYEVALDPQHPGKYRFDDGWRDLQTRNEIVRVLRDERMEEVPLVLEYTHHGPIVARRDGNAYAMRLPYFEEVGLTDQIVEMMLARDLASMKAALGRCQLMPQNIMVATVKGDIYYLRNGRVPVRPRGYDWSRPVPGDTSRTEWLGIHPLADLVQIENPPQGYMQNCNVSPSVMMTGSPLVPARWAERQYLYDEETPYLHQRAAQARAELEAEQELTVERAVEIAHSTAVFNASLWQARLRAARGRTASSAPLSPEARRLSELIDVWDRRAERDSTGATAYYYWKEAVYALGGEVAAGEELGGERRRGAVALLADRGGLAPPDIPDANLLAALQSAAAKLRADWGGLEVPYGRVFRIRREGGTRDFPLGGGSVPGMATPRAVSFRRQPDGKTFVGTGGQTATQIVHLTKTPESFSLLPLGESDDPASPHFDDQAEKLMSPQRLKPTYFLRKQKLLQHVEFTTTIEYLPR